MCRKFFAMVFVLLLACSSVSALDSPLATVPPFDQESTYQVPGVILERLRVDWLELSRQLAISEEAFSKYKRSTQTTELILLVAASVSAGAAIALGLTR